MRLMTYNTIFFTLFQFIEKLQYEDTEPEEKEGYEPQSNIRVFSLNLDKIFEWSPLQDWWREDLRYTLSIWKSVHLSQVARYLQVDL
jgi:hypothetical protein